MSLWSTIFKEEIHDAIIDGQDAKLLIDDFHYYSIEKIKNIPIYSSYILLNNRDKVKYIFNL